MSSGSLSPHSSGASGASGGADPLTTLKHELAAAAEQQQRAQQQQQQQQQMQQQQQSSQYAMYPTPSPPRGFEVQPQQQSQPWRASGSSSHAAPQPSPSSQFDTERALFADYHRNSNAPATSISVASEQHYGAPSGSYAQSEAQTIMTLCVLLSEQTRVDGRLEPRNGTLTGIGFVLSFVTSFSQS